ncbi:MAG: Maf family protein [Coriobacteriia bacterium]|nr:Maf family protein [Coriobacteriia bacterium]
MSNVKIVLASASPRRSQLLQEAGLDFQVLTVPVDELLEPDELKDPQQACKTLAERKAGATVQELLAQGVDGPTMVFGSDTMVVLDGVIFGKPTGHDHAVRMLRALSGRTHQVMTSVSAWMMAPGATGGVSVGYRSFVDVTDVTFRDLSDQDILDYLAKGESFDKAGAYAIQGFGADLVTGIDGAMDTVVGLPVERMRQEFPELFA